jgi:hypothetical protein
MHVEGWGCRDAHRPAGFRHLFNGCNLALIHAFQALNLPPEECGASEFRATRFHSQCHAELVSASIRGWKPCLDSLILDPETSSGRRDVTHSVMPNSFRHLFKACNLALNHLLQVLKQVQDDSNLPYRIRPACDGRSWRRTHHQGSCRGSDLHLRGLLGWHSHSTHLSRIIFFVSMNPPA